MSDQNSNKDVILELYKAFDQLNLLMKQVQAGEYSSEDHALALKNIINHLNSSYERTDKTKVDSV